MRSRLTRATVVICTAVAFLTFGAARAEAAGLPPAWVQDLAVDPTDSTILYAATTAGLHKSTDAGENWTRIGVDLPYPDVTAVAVDPSMPCTVFAGLDSHLFGQSIMFPMPRFIPYNTDKILFVSTDCGLTWTPARTYAGRAVKEFAFTVATPPQLVARVVTNVESVGRPYLEDNIVFLTPTSVNRVHWREGAFGGERQTHIAVDPSDSCVTYLGDAEGQVHKLTTCPSSSPWSAGFSGRASELAVTGLWVNPDDHSLLVGLSGGKIYRKTSADDTTLVFSTTDGGIVTSASVPGHEQQMYAAGRGVIYKSVDGGVTWYPSVRVAATVLAVGSIPVLRAYGAGYGVVRQFGCHVGVSADDTTAPPDCAFTDPLLASGAVAIKAAHVAEPRVRVDRLRARYGLPTFSWTDATLESGLTPVRAQHLLELRQALADVYIAVGQQAPAYTDPDLGVGTVAKGVHVMELRRAIVLLE